MEKRINDYKSFITESKLDMLLEANIVFDQRFSKLLKSIESPLTNKLIRLQGKDVDVNTNFISFDLDKDDKVLFVPDDKALKQPYVISNYGPYDGGIHVSFTNYAEQAGRYEYFVNNNIDTGYPATPVLLQAAPRQNGPGRRPDG